MDEIRWLVYAAGVLALLALAFCLASIGFGIIYSVAGRVL